jgi:hypothetical protein
METTLKELNSLRVQFLRKVPTVVIQPTKGGLRLTLTSITLNFIRSYSYSILSGLCLVEVTSSPLVFSQQGIVLEEPMSSGAFFCFKYFLSVEFNLKQKKFAFNPTNYSPSTPL